MAEYHTKTTAKANCQFKGIPDGKCKFTFTLEFYDTITKKNAVYSDKATQLDVEIKKIIKKTAYSRWSLAVCYFFVKFVDE